jgi:hypothetical protein
MGSMATPFWRMALLYRLPSIFLVEWDQKKSTGINCKRRIPACRVKSKALRMKYGCSYISTH